MLRKVLSVFLMLALGVLSVVPAFAAGNEETAIFVAPNGDNSAKGTKNDPVADIKTAKELAKGLKGDVTVYFREGMYSFNDTVCFDAEDKSGVTYKAYNGEEVVFTSGNKYTGFEECTVNGVRAFRKNVESGTDFNVLFDEHGTLNRTRYPESGYLYVKDVLESDRQPGIYSSEEFHQMYKGMIVNTEDFADFRNLNDVGVRILHWWKDENLLVSSYDSETGHVVFNKTSTMQVRAADKYFLENVFEMLKTPGQWYLDKAENVLYVIPDSTDTVEDYAAWGAVLETMISVDGVDGISFEGIRFQNNGFKYNTGIDFPQAAYDAPTCVSYKNAKDFHIKNCDFKDIAACAVFLGENVQDAAVDSCAFENIGAQAVYIRGENIDVNAPTVTKNIAVTNNCISDYGRNFYNAVGVLAIHANSLDISHNEIHDGYYSAISVGWVWGYGYTVTYNNKICDNLIYNIGQGWLSDMGGIYTLGNQPGTVISGNVIHNVSADSGAGGYGGWGIYLDEGSSYILVEKNLVYSCGSDSYYLHYGSYNMVRNNIFAFSTDSQARVVNAPNRVTPADGGKETAEFYNNIILTDNKVRAVSYLQSEEMWNEYNNLYWDISNGKDIYIDLTNKPKKSMGIKTAVRKGYVTSPILADPMFRDAKSFDFELSEESPAIANGFEKWDYSNAGTLKNSTVGVSGIGGQTPYNAESRAVPQTSSKEQFHLVKELWNLLLTLLGTILRLILKLLGFILGIIF